MLLADLPEALVDEAGFERAGPGLVKIRRQSNNRSRVSLAPLSVASRPNTGVL